jgi:hypothetical protein
MRKRECATCKVQVQQDWAGKPQFKWVNGELYCEECAKPVLEERITHIVCSDCGKELNSNSARLFQNLPWDEWEEWEDEDDEMVEVTWQKKGVRQADGWIPKEMILCSPCAEQYLKRKGEAGERGMKLTRVLVRSMWLLFWVAWMILIFYVIK